MEILLLFAMYGVAFGIQHKLPGMWDGAAKKVFRDGILEALLSCTYCVGFHAGWISYLCYSLHEMSMPNMGGAILFSFAGASFSYTIDAYVMSLEGVEDEDSEEG